MTLHAQASNGTLSLVRTAVFGTWLMSIFAVPLHELSEMPMEVFVPVGIIRLLAPETLTWLLQPAALLFFKWSLAAGLLLCVLGVRPFRSIAITTVLLLTFEQSLTRSFGHINHREIPLLFAAWIMAFTCPGRVRDWNKPAAQESVLAVQMMTFLLLLTYVFTGGARLAQSAPEVFQNGSMTQYVAFLGLCTDYLGMRHEEVLLGSPTLLMMLNIGFVAVTILETLSLACLSSRRFRLIWLGVMVPFHFLSMIFMNIFFWQNLALFAILLGEPGKTLALLRIKLPTPLEPEGDFRRELVEA